MTSHYNSQAQQDHSTTNKPMTATEAKFARQKKDKPSNWIIAPYEMRAGKVQSWHLLCLGGQ